MTQTCLNSLCNTCTSFVPQSSSLFSGLHKNFGGKLPHFRHSVVQKEPSALPHVSTGQSQSQTSLGASCHHLIFLSGPVPKIMKTIISLHQHKLSWKHGASWIRKQAEFLATFCKSFVCASHWKMSENLIWQPAEKQQFSFQLAWNGYFRRMITDISKQRLVTFYKLPGRRQF